MTTAQGAAGQNTPSAALDRRRLLESSLQPGELLGDRYELVAPLGKGGMATAWRAVDQKMRRQVVVKMPLPSLIEMPGFRTRFAREVSDLALLGQHPHIIEIYDLGEHHDVPYCVVQYVAGGDFFATIEHGPVSYTAICTWLPQLAAALDYVHDKGIIHRDVSPANILFDASGNAYLSDFGIAAALSSQSQLTAVGSAIGVPRYMPPEAADRALGPQYDQYSLGVVLYEALGGEPPHSGETARDIMASKLRGQPEPIGNRAELPARAAAAVSAGDSRRSCRALRTLWRPCKRVL